MPRKVKDSEPEFRLEDVGSFPPEQIESVLDLIAHMLVEYYQATTEKLNLPDDSPNT
jgi:hypothetical protein